MFHNVMFSWLVNSEIRVCSCTWWYQSFPFMPGNTGADGPGGTDSHFFIMGQKRATGKYILSTSLCIACSLDTII